MIDAARRARLRLKGLVSAVTERYPEFEFEPVSERDLACDWVRLRIGHETLPILPSQVSANGSIETRVLKFIRDRAVGERN